MLLLVPTEIIIHVFSQLGYRDLLTCSLVCRLFHALVRENASCQYIIELAISGMQDGPPSALGHADRLKLLRDSQAAWDTLQWTASKDVRMLQGSLYELYGGVLAQSNPSGGNGIVFRRLPCHYRGIEEHVWSLEFDIVLRDFTMDPAQDLVVLVAEPVERAGARMETVIHLCSLTTGKAHPLAKLSVLVHDVDARIVDLTFMLQIHSSRVAVHFISHGIVPSELVVWDWKTGETVLNTHGADLMAFAFLTERHVLVGGCNLGQPRLCVVDLELSGGERRGFDAVEYLCAFLYPPCHPWVHALSFLIRSDPCSDWSPHGSMRVPFSIGGGARLYVVTIWVMDGEAVLAIDLFVLSSTLLGHVASVRPGETRHAFAWPQWGPRGTRMMTHVPHSHVWVCYVYGTRFTLVVGQTLEVWDFNPLIGQNVGAAELDTSRRVFSDAVWTQLAYRVVRRQLPSPSEGYTEAMCSEDGLILVDSLGRQFRMLMF